MSATILRFPKRQRGHMDFSAPIGWALTIGLLLSFCGLWALYAGIRMLVR